MTGRKLAVNTTVGGVTYEAGSVPPADVAKLIDNPKVWDDSEDSTSTEPKPAPRKSTARAEK